MEDHLLLGRLYRLNNELLKSENEFKTAVKIQPDSEEAVTTLAYLYNEEGDSSRALQVLNTVPETARTAKLYSALGYTYEQQKEYKQAVEAYRQAVEARPRQPGRAAGSGAKPDERRPDGRRAGAVQGDRRGRSLGRADLHAHRGNQSAKRQIRPGAGSAEEGRADSAGFAGSAVQHRRHR